MTRLKGPHAGRSILVQPDDATRFWGKVARAGDDDCWLWQSTRNGKDADAYGMFGIRARKFLAHRVAYTIAKGPIPCGMLIMHTCDTPLCVNPAHLWAGTQADNLRDMRRKGRAPDYEGIREKNRASHAARTHCARGHVLGPTNTVTRDGKTACRSCETQDAQRAAEVARLHAGSLTDEVRKLAAVHVVPLVPESFALLSEIVGSARSADVLSRSFALFGYRYYTLAEIGVEYGITRERARQIRNVAAQRLGVPDHVVAELPQAAAKTMRRLDAA